MKAYRTTIGGAVSGLGKALMAIGIVPQLSGVPSRALTYIALTGFVLDAVGGFLGHLFSADNKEVQELKREVNETKNGQSEGQSERTK